MDCWFFEEIDCLQDNHNTLLVGLELGSVGLVEIYKVFVLLEFYHIDVTLEILHNVFEDFQGSVQFDQLVYYDLFEMDD